MIGVLLSNLGTPDAPTPEALKKYLRQFLSDRRVVDVPRLIWWFILNFTILPRRAPQSAALYRKIWTDEGSPLLFYSRRLGEKMAPALSKLCGHEIPVVLGMRYGNPSMEDALEQLKRRGCSRILILPLYPQFSASTTGSTFDEFAHVLRNWRTLPEFKWINDYHLESEYIRAAAASIADYRKQNGATEKLLISFHGLPKRYLSEGDPYYYQCHATARAIAKELGLNDQSWSVAFQSRFGKEEWLDPATDKTLQEWAQLGTKQVEIVCPGFPVDCLETLEEIAKTAKENFLMNGGKVFRYIPALNDSEAHADALARLVFRKLKEWL